MKKAFQVFLTFVLTFAAVVAKADPAMSDETPSPQKTDPTIVDIRACKPQYPPMSLAKGEQGKVILKFEISADGEVLTSSITKSSGFPILDFAALNALSTCKFNPGTTNGKPVQSSFFISYVWRIEP